MAELKTTLAANQASLYRVDPERMNSGILLVDDNAIQAATRRAILERTGRRVTLASSGAAALEVLATPEAARNIGLLVTDHLMPGMQGPELVAEVRRRGFNDPVLVLSGLPDAEFAYDGLDIVFRLKPFAPDELIRLAQSLLGVPLTKTA